MLSPKHKNNASACVVSVVEGEICSCFYHVWGEKGTILSTVVTALMLFSLEKNNELSFCNIYTY